MIIYSTCRPRPRLVFVDAMLHGAFVIQLVIIMSQYEI